MFTATLFTIARVWKQTKCLIDQHIKEDVVFIYNGIYSAIKKEEIMPIAATLKLSCEIKKRKINIMHDVIYMWNFSTKQKQTYKDRLVVVKEGAGGGARDRGACGGDEGRRANTELSRRGQGRRGEGRAWPVDKLWE